MASRAARRMAQPQAELGRASRFLSSARPSSSHSANVLLSLATMIDPAVKPVQCKDQSLLHNAAQEQNPCDLPLRAVDYVPELGEPRHEEEEARASLLPFPPLRLHSSSTFKHSNFFFSGLKLRDVRTSIRICDIAGRFHPRLTQQGWQGASTWSARSSFLR